MDPNFYRYYDCNLQCPKMKARELRCPRIGNVLYVNDTSVEVKGDLLVSGNLTVTGDLHISGFVHEPSGIRVYNGTLPFATTHYITAAMLPVLNNTYCNGELSLYMNNGDSYANVTLAAIIKVGGVLSQTLVFQRVGNFTSVEMYASGTNAIQILVNPGATIRWIYRGI